MRTSICGACEPANATTMITVVSTAWPVTVEANRAGPKPATSGEKLEFRQGVAVGEFAGPVGHKTGQREAWYYAENSGKGFLPLPLWRRGQRDRQLAHRRKQRHGKETEPDGAPGRTVAIDFRKDIPTYIGKGKQEFGCAGA